MDFFCVLVWGFFLHFNASGLSPSGLSYDGYFVFFDFGLFLPIYSFWFKSVGFKVCWIFFVFLFWSSFSILLLSV